MSEQALTQRDWQHIRQQLAPEMFTYLGHAAAGKLRPSEAAHLEYLKGLQDRIEAAAKAAT